LPRWHWQAPGSLAMRLLVEVGVEAAAGALAAVVAAAWEAAVATAALAAVV